jgi:hypothetical protein
MLECESRLEDKTTMDNVFAAGELVPYSGVYRITHYPPHASEEAITLAKGNKFPLCVHCPRVSFLLLNQLPKSDLLTYSLEL